MGEVVDPKKAYATSSEKLKQAINDLDCLLKDIDSTATSNVGKNYLFNACKNLVPILQDELKAMNNAEVQMVVDPKAQAQAKEAEIRQILKDVGLKDMDDPNYSLNTVAIPRHPFPITALATKEDAEAFGWNPALMANPKQISQSTGLENAFDSTGCSNGNDDKETSSIKKAKRSRGRPPKAKSKVSHKPTKS